MRIRGVCFTGAGCCFLWNPAAFEHVTDETSHFAALIDDEGVLENMVQGHLVPINDFGDGAYEIEVRILEDTGELLLTPEEAALAFETSKPYKFSTSGEVCLSGLEHVCHPIEELVHRQTIPAGDYVAMVYHFDSDRCVLPEFVVTLQPLGDEHQDLEFCTDEDTFGQQPSLPTGHVCFRVHTCDDWRQLKRDVTRITGHDKATISTLLKHHEPVYLGNGFESPDRIADLLQPLIDVVKSLNGTVEFLVDAQEVDPSVLRTMFPLAEDG